MGAEKEDPKKNITKLNFGMSTAQAAGGTVATHYANAAGQSMEQIWNPIQVVKKKSSENPTPGFQNVVGGSDQGTFGGSSFVGPTILELDPYFSNIMDGQDGTEFFANCDYKLMVHEDGEGATTDLNIQKIENKRNVEKVRVNAHRAPLILSGWGFDLGDRPTPRMGASFPDTFKFDTEVPYNRATWKTGPLAVQWDDERQVWAGGPHIVCGIALGEIKAPKTPCDPTTFEVQLFRKTTDQFVSDTDPENTEDPVGEFSPDTHKITTLLDTYSEDQDGEKVESSDRITVYNRDPSLEQAYVKNAMFVIAIRLNYEWLPLWVGCPEDDIPNEDVPCIIKPKEEEEETDGGDPPTDQEPQVDPPL
jgi:hypothetical protein